MQYLLDTHVLLWWLTEPKKLSTKVQHIIADKNSHVFISSVSIWEIAIKKDLGRLDIPVNILSVLQTENIQVLLLSAEEGLGIIDLPKIHNDPFDRILIAQAKFNDMVFITKDQKIIEYPIITLRA